MYFYSYLQTNLYPISVKLDTFLLLDSKIDPRANLIRSKGLDPQIGESQVLEHMIALRLSFLLKGNTFSRDCKVLNRANLAKQFAVHKIDAKVNIK